MTDIPYQPRLRLMGAGSGDFPPTSGEELTLRRLLFMSHYGRCNTYCDDGELQDSSCGIDFRRDSAQEIDNAMGVVSLQRYITALAGDQSEEHY